MAYPEKRYNLIILLIIGTAMAGAILSGYLFIHHYQESSIDSVFYQLCTVSDSFDCNRVNQSRYSSFKGVPIAGFGLFYYLFILIFLSVDRVANHEKFSLFSGGLFWLMSFFSVLMIFPLALISVSTLKTYCLFCMVVWLCNIGLFLLLWEFIRQKTDASFWKVPGIVLFSCFGFLKQFHKALAYVFLLFAISFSLLAAIFFGGKYLGIKQELERAGSHLQELDKLISEFYTRPVQSFSVEGLPVFHGKPGSEVTIVEYADFNCPVCKRGLKVMEELASHYPGKVGVYLKNYPLDSTCNPEAIHNKGGLPCLSALISVSLRGKEGYHHYVDQIMNNEQPLSFKQVEEALIDLGMKPEDLKNMFKDGNAKALLDQEIQEAIRLGVKSTPSFLINGRLISGLPQFYLLNRLIQVELNVSLREKFSGVHP